MKNTKITYCPIRRGEFGIWFTILDFNCYHTVGEIIESSKFPLDSYEKFKFTLIVYPNGENEMNKDFVSLYLCPDKLGLHIDCQLFVYNGKRNNLNFNHLVHTFCEGNLGFPRYIKRADLPSILNDNRMEICCTIKVCESSHPPNPSTDFQKLLDERTLTDVELLVGQKKFCAHKAVLAARSSVFAAMFMHDMVEERSNQVIISDITEDVFEEMLHFMYTNKRRNISTAAEKLLIAADKYDIAELKVGCEEILYKQLDIKNVFNSLSFADLHHAKHLKTGAIICICTHAAKMMVSSSWKDEIQLISPHLLAEVFRTFVLQHSSSTKSSDQT